MKHKHCPHYRLGLTLVELMLAIAIFSIALILIIAMFMFFMRSYSFNLNQNITISETKYALDLLVRELRETQVSEIGAYPLITVADQELAFYANIDDDEQVERVRYYLSGNTLYRSVTQPSDSIEDPYANQPQTTTEINTHVYNQTRPIFQYYNADWPADTQNNPLPMSDRLLYTKLIAIELYLNTAPETQQDLLLSTQVHLRNLKTEY